jgi:hypothetical protein
MSIENNKTKIRGHPREWFVYPEVEATIKALEKISVKCVAKWKYRFPWNDNNTRKEIYPISYPKLSELIQKETERTEKERTARKTDLSKKVYYSSFYVYTRKDGPGSALKFAFYFSRKSYRKNKAICLKKEIERQKAKATRRELRYEKPILIHENKKEEYSQWRFDEEAFWEKIRKINAELREMNRSATPVERAEKRWKEIVHQDVFFGATKPILAYSKAKTSIMVIENDLKKTIIKNKEDEEKRKWKAPPQGYQLGMSNEHSKQYFCEFFKKHGYEDISSAFLKNDVEHVQKDIPAKMIPIIFSLQPEDPTLQFNIYKKNRNGYPVTRYCFPKEKGIETLEEAELVFFQKKG